MLANAEQSMNKISQKVNTLDEDIDTMMTVQMSDRVPANAEIQKSDIVAIGFLGRLVKDDGSLEELPFQGGVAPYMLIKRFDNGQFLPGFEDGMKGMKVGETRTVEITFPKNYVAHLASKKASFEVVVISAYRLPVTLSHIDTLTQELFKAKALKDEAEKKLSQETVETAAAEATTNA